MNNMDIKQGDTVRVSGHYLAIMIADGIVHNALNNATFVVDNIDSKGRMAYVSCKLPISLQSPIAHLIKVDAEAKEAKFKAGDRVRSKGYGLEAVVLGIDGEFIAVRRDDGIKQEWNISITELVSPTEQTEAEKPNHTITIPVEVDLTDSYWEAYTADLAREIAVKSMENSYGCDPERIADYVVSVAKAVVDGLKRK